MPDSFIQLPADSTGKKLRTYDTGTEHVQYVIPYMPHPTYTAETPLVAEALAGAVKIYLAAMNPIGSAKLVRIRSIWVVGAGAVLAASAYDFRAYRISAIVGGTAVTAAKNDTTNAASVVTTLVHTATSVTPALTTNLWSSRWAFIRTTSGTFGDVPGQLVRFGAEGQQPPTFRAGEGFAIEETTRTAGNDLYVGVEWTEE